MPMVRRGKIEPDRMDSSMVNAAWAIKRAFIAMRETGWVLNVGNPGVGFYDIIMPNNLLKPLAATYSNYAWHIRDRGAWVKIDGVPLFYRIPRWAM